MFKTLNLKTVTLLAVCAALLITSVSWAKDSDVVAKVGKYTLTLKQFNEQIKELPPQLQMALKQRPDSFLIAGYSLISWPLPQETRVLTRTLT